MKKSKRNLWDESVNKAQKIQKKVIATFKQPNMDTGKSLLKALILAGTNPQYHKRLFTELRVKYMKTTS